MGCVRVSNVVRWLIALLFVVGCASAGAGRQGVGPDRVVLDVLAGCVRAHPAKTEQLLEVNVRRGIASVREYRPERPPVSPRVADCFANAMSGRLPDRVEVSRFVAVSRLAVEVTGPRISPINPIIGDTSWHQVRRRPPHEGDDEAERIRVHLRYVHNLLLRGGLAVLSPDQQAKRSESLAALSEYIERGQFPRHSRRASKTGRRQPRFIDDRGTLCAVAHLLVRSGHPELADAMNRGHEYDTIAEMADERLTVWARERGFSLLELAMIQPAYPPPPPPPLPDPERLPEDFRTREHLLAVWKKLPAKICAMTTRVATDADVNVAIGWRKAGPFVHVTGGPRTYRACIEDAVAQEILPYFAEGRDDRPLRSERTIGVTAVTVQFVDRILLPIKHKVAGRLPGGAARAMIAG